LTGASGVLSEVLTFFCEEGPYVRRTVAAYTRSILSSPAITVHPQSDQSFLGGLALHEARPDKEYSHADCISMRAMRLEGIAEVLTDDDHFKQEGFTILL
jgi:predicted nucleic acid-binding protein